MEGETTETLVAYCMETFGKSHPHIPQAFYEEMARKGLGTRPEGNYFARDKMRNWMSRTIPHVTPEILSAIKGYGVDNFLYNETHQVGEGYTPLAEQDSTSRGVLSALDRLVASGMLFPQTGRALA